MRRSRSLRNKAVLAKATLALALAAAGQAATAASTQPAIFPAPVSLRLAGAGFALGDSVLLVRPPGTDPASEQQLRQALQAAGVRHIRTAATLPARQDTVQVVFGLAGSEVVKQALRHLAAAPPTRPEAYVLASSASDGAGLIVLAGNDGDGLYHGTQSFRQILAHGQAASVAIDDYPAMPVRGTIEGFYGKPWSMAEREAHIGFLARFKANTYIYSPKDDVYARDRWREPYPVQTLDALQKVVDVANREHVNFVYALSPGPSVCYSDPTDLAAVRRKFAALRQRGVRSFYVAFDDIEYTRWNCKGDEAMFGAPGEQAAAKAQARLLNAVQADVAAAGHGALIMVPTEYYNVTESPYKATLRQALDPRVVVQWTGTDVVPAEISVRDAQDATKAFGRKTLLWDNYPVNDYAETTGRLLMAPYDRRQAGLSAELSGIVANPMNQEASSRPAVAGLLSFAWNDHGYDPQLTWRAAALDLAGNDPVAAEALLAFFDTQHLAPTFGKLPWQPQSPRLKADIDAVRVALADGDPQSIAAALQTLATRADALGRAPALIRADPSLQGFASEASPWLDATQLWAHSLRLTVDALSATLAGKPAAAAGFEEARRVADQAKAIPSIPGATRFEGPVKVADGVLDRFIADAPGLVYGQHP